MSLAHGVVFWATRKIVYAAVNFDGDSLLPDGKIHNVAANFVLTHDMRAFFSKKPQRFPSARLGTCRHAVANFGAASARRISQAPIRIIGAESSMPMVTRPRSASGMCESGSRTNSSNSRNRP